MILSIILLLIVYGQFIFGFFILRSNWKSRENRLLAGLCISISLWIAGIYFLQSTGQFYWSDKISLLGAIGASSTFYFFTAIFPKNILTDESGNQNIATVFYQLIPQILLIAVLPFNLVIKNITYTHKDFVATNGPLFSDFALVQLMYVVFSFRNLILQFKIARAADRQRIFYIFWGLALFFFIGMTCDVLLPLLNFDRAKYIGPLGSLIFILFSSISVITYKLMDIRIALRTIFSYTVASISALVVLWIFRYDSDFLNATLFLASFVIIERVANALFSRLFLGHYFRFRECMRTLNAVARTTTSSRKLIVVSINTLREALHARWICFTMRKIKALFLARIRAKNIFRKLIVCRLIP